MYTSVSKTSTQQKQENKSSGCRYWKTSSNDVAGTSSTDPVGLLSRQGPGRGIVGLVGPYRASTDRLDAMEDREEGVDDEESANPPRSAKRRGEGNGVGVSGVGGEGRVFMLRDEELVEEGDYRHSQESLAEKPRKRSPEDDDGILDVSPTPGRENWRLRECKNMTGDAGSGVEDRGGMSMADIWPKHWGSKYFCVSHFLR
jgi:hypothetical protein